MREPIESAGIDGLRAPQLTRMQDVLGRAYKQVPHAKARFDTAQAHPDHPRTLDDIAKLPLTAKEDLRRNYPFGMFTVPMQQIVRIQASSGTTEIIDLDSGLPVADGEAGELVITTLTKEGMPLIRYRTRELTRLLPPATRPMRRSDDMLIIRGVNVFPSTIEAGLAREEKLAPHYLPELRRAGSLDELDVIVETRNALAGNISSAELLKLEGRAENLSKVFVGITAKVRVVEPGTLERSQGKAKRVLDLRPRD